MTSPKAPPAPDPGTLATRLKARMIELEVSLSTVAAGISSSKSAVGEWYAGTATPSDRRARALAIYLGLAPLWLKTGEGPRAAELRPFSPVDRRLVRLRGRVTRLASELKAARKELRLFEAERAAALASAEEAAFHRGES